MNKQETEEFRKIRRNQILQYLKSHEMASSKVIAASLKFCVSTVKNDLAVLQRKGLVKRYVRFVGNSRVFLWNLTSIEADLPHEEIRLLMSKLSPGQLENIIINFADYGLNDEHLKAIVRASTKVLRECA